jgi:hypothetical protein
VQDSTITRFAHIKRTYAPGVAWSGMGQRISSSTISNGRIFGSLVILGGTGQTLSSSRLA